MNSKKLRLVLYVLGAESPNLSLEDYGVLGFDIYKFNYYGKPTTSELKDEAADIVTEMFLRLENAVELLETRISELENHDA